MRSNTHTRPPHRLNRAPKAGLAKSRGRHGSLPHCVHSRPNFTGDRSEARGHGAAHAVLPPVCLGAGCACWCAPDGFAARKRRGGTQGAATPEVARRGGPPPAWSSLMWLLRPHRAVAAAPRAPTDARGDHARPVHALLCPGTQIRGFNYFRLNNELEVLSAENLHSQDPTEPKFPSMTVSAGNVIPSRK